MNKQERAGILDPQRFQINKNMAVVPGGPENNNAMNVTSINTPQITAMSIMGDHQQNYPQMGTQMVNPVGVQASGLQQNFPMGRSLNAGTPYNMQPQPTPNTEEPMEGMRLGETAMQKGIMSSQFMGPTGSAAILPGAMDPTIPGSGVPLGNMPTVSQVVGGEMVPGSTPTKIQKKGKK